MRQSPKFAVFFSLVSGSILAAGAAQAAPQALGLTASLRPTPMRCDAAGCRADLSAFCLQQQRADPHPGTVYQVAPGTRVTLLITGHDGRQSRLDGARALSFIDDRGFVSITARLKPEALAGLDVAAVAIEVGQDAALLPETTAGDSNPQGEDELALATGANRRQAETFYDKPGRDADAIRLTNAMINELPPGRPGTGRYRRPSHRRGPGAVSGRAHREGWRQPRRDHPPELRRQDRCHPSGRQHAQLPGGQP